MILAAKQNPPGVERQRNSISLAASRQVLFPWRYGRQKNQNTGKIYTTPRKINNRQKTHGTIKKL